MANVGIYQLTDTWNSGGTTFNGIKIDVTDTASAAGSKLLDLQVGSVSKFNVGKDGTVVTAAGLTSTGNINGASPTEMGYLSGVTSGIQAQFNALADNIPDYVAPQTLTDAATIAWAATSGVNAKVTLGGDRTLGAMTGMVDGQAGTLTVIQDGTGSRSLTLNAQYVVISGDAGEVASQTSSKRSFLAWQYDSDSAKVYVWITHEP